MDKIRIQNLRALKDTHETELKPLTLLVGANSTGKSTFLRTFPLLSQSLLVNKQGPILWYGSEVDFGSFNDAVSYGENTMTFSFFWRKITHPWLIHINDNFHMDDVSLIVEVAKKTDESYLKKLLIKLGGDQEIDINFDDEILSNSNIFINGVNIKGYSLNHYFLSYSNGSFIPPVELHATNRDNDKNLMELFFKFFKNKGISMKSKKNDYDLDKIMIGSQQMVLDSVNKLFNLSLTSEVFGDPIWRDINNLIILRNLFMISRAIDITLQNELSQLMYIKPFRASAERYYRIQNLAIKKLESDGHNLAMYIKNMYKNSATKKKFHTWTESNFKFIIDATESQGHISLSIKENGEEKSSNIIDKGYGYSQILPVIITLWQIYNDPKSKGSYNSSRIIAIEQPELHLHPKLQMNLIDTIISVIKEAINNGMDIKFLIETHSQTIVNRLGSLIADQQYSADDVSILLFHEDNVCNNPQVANYLSNGHLSNWPIGFFNPID